jgi:hypothetical protein
MGIASGVTAGVATDLSMGVASGVKAGVDAVDTGFEEPILIFTRDFFIL